MITFLVSIVLLVLGYFTYGKYIEKMFGPQHDRSTFAHGPCPVACNIPVNKKPIPFKSKDVVVTFNINVANVTIYVSVLKNCTRCEPKKITPTILTA